LASDFLTYKLLKQQEMKKQIGFLIMAIAIIAFGCKPADDTGISIKMENMIVSPTFDWETNHNVEFSVSTTSATIIRIRSEDGSLIYHQGFHNKLEEPYTIQLNLPKVVKRVLVNDKLITLISNKTTVQLNHSNSKEAMAKIISYPQPILHWSFNENQGSVVSEENNWLPGIATGHTWVSGINGNGIQFDGQNGHIRIDHDGSWNPVNDKISFSCWFKLNNIGASGALLFHNTKYFLRMDPQGRLTFALYTPTYKDVVMRFADRILDTDWHFLTATYDGSIMKLYLDGNLMGTTEASGSINSRNAPVYIGCQNTINFFNGQIDEMQIFDKALSETDIELLYTSSNNPGNGDDYLISYWKLNENQGTTTADQTGNNHGTISNAGWVTGVSGSCLSFNGTNGLVSIPNHPTLSPSETITMMAWAKTRENKTAKIFQKGDWDGHGLGQSKWDGWFGNVRTADDVSHSLHWQGGVPVMNVWYHLTLTYDGSTLRFYVNGQLHNSKALSGSLKVNSRNVSIGSDNGAQKHFNGDIDEVKFYGAALNQTEIQSNYTNIPDSNDQDGDGVADQDDNYPTDPARAFNNFFPVEGFGSLAFEDLWPSKGDYDFNDLVLDYRFKVVSNANNKVSEVMAEFVIKAIGAGFENGFGFQFNDNTIRIEDVFVEGSVLHEDFIQLNPNGTETEQDELTVIVFDNANKILQPASGFGVNVFPEQLYVEPDTIRITIILTPNLYTINDLSLHNFNPFLIINKERGKEVHLPNRRPTSLADRSYFGEGQDNSDPGSGRYYKTAENLPWALNISSSYDHTIESAQITSAHLKFAAWAQSSGKQFPDWYLNLPGYRDNTKIFQHRKHPAESP
jgi:LruC domain-containing protein